MKVATLSLGALLKAGLAVVATGSTIATPILLNRRESKTSSTATSDSSNDNSHNSDSSRESESTISSAKTDSESPSQINLEASSTSVSTTSKGFEKTCFEIPANYQETKDIKLLTCFDTVNSINEHREENPSYDSEFHLYDLSRNKVPLKIEGYLFWEHKEKKITAKMKKETRESNEEYIFAARGDEWNRVSSDSKIDLLDQCETYKVTSEGSINFGKFWLSCADNTDETFDPNSPTAIPLTSWIYNRSSAS